MSDIGHNSLDAGRLKSFGQRIQKLNAERKELQDDIKEVYAEAKGNGFDTKILRKVIALRKKDVAERQEEESMIDVYLAALGAPVTREAAE